MTIGNNNKNNYTKEAILPIVAILGAKNSKVKYDLRNFSQGTCSLLSLKCNNNMWTITLTIICVSVLKFEIEIPWSIFCLPLDSINKWGLNQILWVFRF